jgi:hypothetical protein
MRLKLCIVTTSMVFVLLSFTKTEAQDPNFAQFFNLPTYFNPAATGLNSGLHARFLYRNQWPNLPASYKSYLFSADMGERNLPG